jgi:hypothetical protein
MAQFKVLAGTHAEGREIFRKGDVCSSDLDLVEVFGSEKFESLEPVPVPQPVVVEVVEEEEEEEADEEDEESENIAGSFYGLKKFVKDGLSIVERSDGYWVFDGDSPVNEQPLEKSKVKSFVVDYFG